MLIPSCSAVVDTTGARWYVKAGKRYEIPTQDIFDSWDFPTIYYINDSSVYEQTEPGGILGIRPGTFCKSMLGAYWYISERGRHRVENPLYLPNYRVSRVSRKSLSYHTELEPLE